MSKLACVCGHIIRDQTDNLSYKGFIIRDKHYDTDFDLLLDEMASFIKATQIQRRQEWINDHFGKEYGEIDLDDASVLSDLWGAFKVKNGLTIYQCEKCGRVHIEGKKNYFHSFNPDEATSNDVLDIDLEASI